MALGTGHIQKLFEPGQPAPDVAAPAAQLREEAIDNPAAVGFLAALEEDFPELQAAGNVLKNPVPQPKAV